jgi:REP element-mobilizing transposase RayT
LVFSTKNRTAWLDEAVRPRLHAYLATTIRDLDSRWVVVGGVGDHVHLLFDMGKMVPPVKFVAQVKRESPKFIKTLGAQYKNSYWQRGCGMFSVSPKDHDEAERYVRNREEHRRNRSFQDEYRAMLTRYGIEFDEQYIWD